jgi:hypothetical protein
VKGFEGRESTCNSRENEGLCDVRKGYPEFVDVVGDPVQLGGKMMMI